MIPGVLLVLRQWLQPWEWTAGEVVDVAQVLGAVATVGALVFTAVELRASARERARLTRRLGHDRLEDLAIAVARAEHTVQTSGSPFEILRDLAELRARLTALTESEHPEAWRLGGASEDLAREAEAPTVDIVEVVTRLGLKGLAARAREETFEALRVSSLSLDRSPRRRR